MQVSVTFDADNAADVRRARDYLDLLVSNLLAAPAGLRPSIEEILALSSGDLLRLAYEHFGTARFNLVALAQRATREVASLHSLAANLGRACAQRGVEVFDRHGGQPVDMSIRPDVARVLADLAA